MLQLTESDVRADLLPELRHENGGSLLVGENLLQHGIQKVPPYALR